MRSRIKTTLALLLFIPIAGVSVRSASAQGAPTGSAAHPTKIVDDDTPLPFEIEGGYTYLRTNEPPGSCTCFGMQGGNGTFAWTIKDSGVGIVADVAAIHAGTIASTGYNLTILSTTGGIRYSPPVKSIDIQPFGQALFGIAHASGTGAQSPNPAAGNAGAAFALNVGGGIDLPVSRRFSVRLFEADYLMTTFDNGGNNRQNNLRVSLGAVFHF
jgi:hypothetical protein